MRVLIVGAGVAGLSLGQALRDRGIVPEVVERVAAWESGGAGLYLPGNAERALRALGLGAVLDARAKPIRRQRFLDHRGRSLADIDVERVWEGVGRCVAIRRAELHEALREAVMDVPVVLGTSVTDLEVGDAPQARFADGSVGTYDLVVGADGIHSTIRSLALGGPAAHFVGQASWRFLAVDVPDVADWTVLLGRGRTFLTVALGDGVVYCYADVDAADPADAAHEDWRDRLSDFAEPVPSLLEQGADAYFAPIEEVTPAAWTARGVALVGDASHASSPNMAQGLRWPSRTLSCSPSCSRSTDPSVTLWPATSSAARLAWPSCRSRPTAAIARDGCARSSETSPCVPPQGASTDPTTGCSEICRSGRIRLRSTHRGVAQPG